MLEQVGKSLIFYCHFVASKTGKTGLTVTVDAWEIARDGTATEIVSAASAVEIGDGLYRYLLAAGSNDTAAEYIAVFKTADSSVDAQWIPALWVVQRAGVENLDAATSSRLATAGYTAPDSAEDIANAVWDEPLAGHVGAGSAGTALGAAGAAADPLSNAVPGTYATGTAGAALGRIGAGQIVTTSIVSQSGSASIEQGYDYYSADGRALSWTDAEGSWPNLTGASAVFVIDGCLSQAATIANPGGPATISVELSKAQTAEIPAGQHSFAIDVTLSNTHLILQVKGSILVRAKVAA